MSVDIGIPLCGILQIHGSDLVPPNFVPMDGQTLVEPRSPLNGRVIPRWNRSDIEVIPYQLSPYTGSVVQKSNNYSYKIVESNLPAIDMVSSRTFTLSAGSAVTTGSGGKTSASLGSDTYFAESIVYGSNDIYTDTGEALAGSDRRHIIINDDAATFVLELEHTHSYSLQHSSSTYGGANHSWVAKDSGTTHGLKINPSSGTPTLKTNGSTNPTNVNFSLLREAIRTKWYIRVY